MQNSSIGLISANAFLDEDTKPNEGIQSIYQNIIDFKSKPPSDEEVKEIKKELLKNLDASFNSGNITAMENIMDVMSDGNNYITYEAYKEMIEALTPQNIYEMTKYLDLNKAAIVVSHPKGLTNEQIQEINKNHPYATMPIDIAGNSPRVNYLFYGHGNQLTNDKYYSTTLQDGSKVFFINSPEDNCEISWKLKCENNYTPPRKKDTIGCPFV